MARLPMPFYNPPYSIKDSFSDLLTGPPVTEAADTFTFPQSFDWVENIAPFTSSMGEMDISRLLLDESWSTIPTASVKQKQGPASDVNGAPTDLPLTR